MKRISVCKCIQKKFPLACEASDRNRPTSRLQFVRKLPSFEGRACIKRGKFRVELFYFYPMHAREHLLCRTVFVCLREEVGANFKPVTFPARSSKRRLPHRGIGCLRHGVLLVFAAPCQLRLLTGREHGRTIPLADISPSVPGHTHASEMSSKRQSILVHDIARLSPADRAKNFKGIAAHGSRHKVSYRMVVHHRRSLGFRSRLR